MGCKHYTIGTDREDFELSVTFASWDDETTCLCTFPHNYEHDKKLGAADVRSMAMLGAAVAMAWHGRMDHGEDMGGYAHATLPGNLPEWVVAEIKRLLPETGDADGR